MMPVELDRLAERVPTRPKHSRGDTRSRTRHTTIPAQQPNRDAKEAPIALMSHPSARSSREHTRRITRSTAQHPIAPGQQHDLVAEEPSQQARNQVSFLVAVAGPPQPAFHRVFRLGWAALLRSRSLGCFCRGAAQVSLQRQIVSRRRSAQAGRARRRWEGMHLCRFPFGEPGAHTSPVSSLTRRREALTEDARRFDYEAVRPKRHRTGLQKSGLPKHDRCPLMRPRVEQRHHTAPRNRWSALR